MVSIEFGIVTSAYSVTSSDCFLEEGIQNGPVKVDNVSEASFCASSIQNETAFYHSFYDRFLSCIFYISNSKK